MKQSRLGQDAKAANPRAAPTTGKTQTGNHMSDYDQMIFSQFLDEEESELVARQLQDEMYGGPNGVTGSNRNPMGFPGEADPSVR